jgi:hypothetical protein
MSVIKRRKQKTIWNSFWELVTDCLVTFHGIERTEAEGTVRTFIGELVSLNGLPDDDIVYHNEPFNLACDLARNDVAVDDDVLARYRALQDSSDR